MKLVKSICPFAVLMMLVLTPGAASSQGLPQAASPKSAIVCMRYTAPSGDDSGSGTAGKPFRTVQHLVEILRPGETGCVAGGVYRENVAIRHGGRPGKRITLTGVKGRAAIIRGLLFVAQGGDHVTVRDLTLNGNDGGTSNPPSPQINGNDVRLENVDITNDHTGICLVLGGAAETYGIPQNTVIVRSRIHDCGRLPATSYEHGIYVAHARGAVIADNYIYDNADWGIVLYPDAIGSRVVNNVLDANGSGLIIAGNTKAASSGNTVARNILSNSRRGYNLTSFWPAEIGRGNIVRENCVWNGASGEINGTSGGFVLTKTRRADPRYVARGVKDFRLATSSPCSGYGPRGH